MALNTPDSTALTTTGDETPSPIIIPDQGASDELLREFGMEEHPRGGFHGLRLGGRAYVRPKQTPDERLAPYYSLRNVSMVRECPLGDELYTPRLAETVRDTLHALLPLYEFCLSAVG